VFPSLAHVVFVLHCGHVSVPKLPWGIWFGVDRIAICMCIDGYCVLLDFRLLTTCLARQYVGLGTDPVLSTCFDYVLSGQAAVSGALLGVVA